MRTLLYLSESQMDLIRSFSSFLQCVPHQWLRIPMSRSLISFGSEQTPVRAVRCAKKFFSCGRCILDTPNRFRPHKMEMGSVYQLATFSILCGLNLYGVSKIHLPDCLVCQGWYVLDILGKGPDSGSFGETWVYD